MNFNDIKNIFVNYINRPHSPRISLLIGDCGSGKSSYATAIALKYMKKGFNVYSNIYIKGAYQFSLDDLMNNDLGENSIVVFDEAATYGLASRGSSYKDSNKPNVIEFFTMYRHYKVQHTIIISPSFQDVIPVVRSRVKNITVVQPTIFQIFGFVKTRSIGKYIEVVGGKEGGSEPKEVYRWRFLSTRFHSVRLAWKCFDTYSRKQLNYKSFPMW